MHTLAIQHQLVNATESPLSENEFRAGKSFHLQPAQLAQVRLCFRTLSAPDENIFVPLCSTCRNPITDLEEGLLVHDWGSSSTAIGQMDTVPLEHVNTTIYAVHKGECDSTALPCSIPLSWVFKSDQRSPIEKRWHKTTDKKRLGGT